VRKILPGIIAFLAIWIIAAYLGPWCLKLTHIGIESYPLKNTPLNWFPIDIIKFLKFLIFVGPAEEFLYRGYVQNKMMNLSCSKWGLPRPWAVIAAVIISSIIFAVMHIPQRVIIGVFKNDLIMSLIWPLLSGLLFGYVFYRTDNLLLVSLIHGLFDLSAPLISDIGWEVNAFADGFSIALICSIVFVTEVYHSFAVHINASAG
jgi:membrane protease YdiL (CAAX protease family)